MHWTLRNALGVRLWIAFSQWSAEWSARSHNSCTARDLLKRFVASQTEFEEFLVDIYMILLHDIVTWHCYMMLHFDAKQFLLFLVIFWQLPTFFGLFPQAAALKCFCWHRLTQSIDTVQTAPLNWQILRWFSCFGNRGSVWSLPIIFVYGNQNINMCRHQINPVAQVSSLIWVNCDLAFIFKAQTEE